KSKDPRHLLFIGKIGIAKLLEPGKIVEDRVIDAVGAAGCDIGGRHTQMLLKRAVFGAATEVTDRDIALRGGRSTVGVADRLGWGLRRGGARLIGLLPGFINRASLGAGYGFGNVAQELLQTGHG